MEIIDKSSIQPIVEGCIKGEKKAQHELYRLYYGKMMSVCYRYANDSDDAKDILHDGFLKVYTHIKKYNFKGSLEGWIRRIIVNTAIDHYRRGKHVFSMSESNMDNDLIESRTIDEDVFAQLNEKVLLEAISNLSPAYKLVFNMYAIEGYSHKEIAKELNINIGTSKSNLAKARMNLQKELEKKYNYHHGE